MSEWQCWNQQWQAYNLEAVELILWRFVLRNQLLGRNKIRNKIWTLFYVSLIIWSYRLDVKTHHHTVKGIFQSHGGKEKKNWRHGRRRIVRCSIFFYYLPQPTVLVSSKWTRSQRPQRNRTAETFICTRFNRYLWIFFRVKHPGINALIYLLGYFFFIADARQFIHRLWGQNTHIL